MIDGRTTITDAAIISPQSRISEPLSERRATATVIFPVLLIKIKAYRNSFQGKWIGADITTKKE